MSRPVFLASRPVRAGYVLGCSHKCRPPDNTPTGTYITEVSLSRHKYRNDALRPIGFLYEGAYDQLFVFRLPHPVFRVCIND